MEAIIHKGRIDRKPLAGPKFLLNCDSQMARYQYEDIACLLGKDKIMAEKNKAMQKHKRKFPLLTVLMVASIVLLGGALLRPILKIRARTASRVVFGTNMKVLWYCLRVYSNESDNFLLPTVDKWCDLLIESDYCSPKQFLNKASDAILGESNVAINKYVAGKRLRDIPDDVVLLFETDFGKDPRGRQELLKNRGYYKTFQIGDPNSKVYKHRWNQAGGPDSMTTHHKFQQGGRAYYVAFANGQVMMVRKADLPSLKWKPDPNDN